MGFADNTCFDRIDIFNKYKNIIKVSQLTFANNWQSIIGNYSNEECLIIGYAFNYLSMMSKESK